MSHVELVILKHDKNYQWGKTILLTGRSQDISIIFFRTDSFFCGANRLKIILYGSCIEVLKKRICWVIYAIYNLSRLVFIWGKKFWNTPKAVYSSIESPPKTELLGNHGMWGGKEKLPQFFGGNNFKNT